MNIKNVTLGAYTVGKIFAFLTFRYIIVIIKTTSSGQSVENKIIYKLFS